MGTILQTRRLSIYASKIQRGTNGEDKPWRGYCWGSDWPKARFAQSTTCYCLDLSWLCYFVSTYWNKPATQPEPPQ